MVEYTLRLPCLKLDCDSLNNYVSVASGMVQLSRPYSNIEATSSTSKDNEAGDANSAGRATKAEQAAIAAKQIAKHLAK